MTVPSEIPVVNELSLTPTQALVGQCMPSGTVLPDRFSSTSGGVLPTIPPLTSTQVTVVQSGQVSSPDSDCTVRFTA
jgi:hypothetical protein